MHVGIESINVYGGQTYMDVRTLFEARGLDLERFGNLMMEKKAVGLPCEDGITHAVNAARPLLDRYSEAEKQRIELVITATESATDFAKSMSTHIHKYLGLSRNCRLFELKQACYGGTAALQMAASWIKSQASPGAKALVLAADTIMLETPDAQGGAPNKFSYAEPSAGVAGMAMIVSDNPAVLTLDFGANGYFSYEVNDVCRPSTKGDAGDPDLSLLSYLDCLEGSFASYISKVEGADFQNTFDYLAFHTPFAGMVKGAHRKAMRTFTKNVKPHEIDSDFQRRVMPSLKYCVQVGGVYSATLYFALCSLLDNIPDLDTPKRVGMFSYGSGCASEFYSGVITPTSQAEIRSMKIGEALANRYSLSMAEYDKLLRQSAQWEFGVNNKEVDIQPFYDIYKKHFEGKGYLVLKGVKDFQREYAWS
jgi:polyketide biosynthesis 3-hydroxy-3-methylglutaryl-CoA synthase-like enzyme PksG